MTVTVTVANSVPAGSLGAAFSSFSASGLFTLTGVEDTLTAHAGGTQAAALALSATKNYHRISVCATAGDSVALPPATVGQSHFVRNDGAASCQVYGTTPDTIDGVATATGIALPAGVGRWFVCTTAAKWYTDEATTTTGSGANVLATSPTLVTPNIGAATGTSLTTSGRVGDQDSRVYAASGTGWTDVAIVTATNGSWAGVFVHVDVATSLPACGATQYDAKCAAGQTTVVSSTNIVGAVDVRYASNIDVGTVGQFKVQIRGDSADALSHSRAKVTILFAPYSADAAPTIAWQ